MDFQHWDVVSSIVSIKFVQISEDIDSKGSVVSRQYRMQYEI